MSGFHPHSVGTHLVVAGAAEIGGSQELRFLEVVFRRILPFTGAVLGLSRLGDPVEIVGDIPGIPGDGVAEIAGYRFIGPAHFFRPRRRSISCQKSHRGVTAVASCLDSGHYRIFIGMRNGQFEIFDLVPVMCIGLGCIQFEELQGSVITTPQFMQEGQNIPGKRGL